MVSQAKEPDSDIADMLELSARNLKQPFAKGSNGLVHNMQEQRGNVCRDGNSKN